MESVIGCYYCYGYCCCCCCCCCHFTCGSLISSSESQKWWSAVTLIIIFMVLFGSWRKRADCPQWVSELVSECMNEYGQTTKCLLSGSRMPSISNDILIDFCSNFAPLGYLTVLVTILIMKMKMIMIIFIVMIISATYQRRVRMLSAVCHQKQINEKVILAKIDLTLHNN